LQVAGDDPGVLTNAAYALAYFGEDIGAMMALVDRALAINPSFDLQESLDYQPRPIGERLDPLSVEGEST
jgi:hypothetical protein